MLVSFLISIVGKRFGVVLAKILPYLLLLGAILFGVWYIYDAGFDNGVAETESKYHLAIEKERHRQLEANQAALDRANQRQTELEQLLGERDETLRQLSEESVKDPDANRPAINVDSVRRINRIN